MHLYREIVKTTMKMILVAVTTIFWVSMMKRKNHGASYGLGNKVNLFFSHAYQ